MFMTGRKQKEYKKLIQTTIMRQKGSMIKICFLLVFRANFCCYEGRKSGKSSGAAGIWDVSAGSPEAVRGHWLPAEATSWVKVQWPKSTRTLREEGRQSPCRVMYNTREATKVSQRSKPWCLGQGKLKAPLPIFNRTKSKKGLGYFNNNDPTIRGLHYVLILTLCAHTNIVERWHKGADCKSL